MWLILVVGGLATWRITSLLLYENGPFELLRRARKKLGVVYYDDSSEVASFKYEITVCPWCVSLWIGSAVALWLRFMGDVGLGEVGLWLLLPLAFSAASMLMHQVARKVSDRGVSR